MSDATRPPLDPSDEDRAYAAWLKSRPEQPERSASVEFMEMMREAAARRAEAQAAKAQIRLAARRAQADAAQAEAMQKAEAEAQAERAAQEAVAAMMDAGETMPLKRGRGKPISPPPEPAKPPTARERAAARAAARETREQERAEAVASAPMRRGARAVGVVGGFVRSVLVFGVAAVLTATVFMWATPNEFINPELRGELGASSLATEAALTQSPANLAAIAAGNPTPNWERRVGVVSGHRGGAVFDPGAVCPDGLTENAINYSVAQRVVDSLQARGYDAVLLDEFDTRLNEFEADALLSIHANTCRDFGERVSGYLISAAAARMTARGNDQVLVDCVSRHYAAAVGLQRRSGVTLDMTDYHTFREIGPLTPAAIIELGFMLADRDILENRPEDMARGITDGILCFIEPGSPQSRFALPTPTVVPGEGETPIPFTPLPTIPPGI